MRVNIHSKLLLIINSFVNFTLQFICVSATRVNTVNYLLSIFLMYKIAYKDKRHPYRDMITCAVAMYVPLYFIIYAYNIH